MEAYRTRHELQFYATDAEMAGFLDLDEGPAAGVHDSNSHVLLATASVQTAEGCRVRAHRVPGSLEAVGAELWQFLLAPEAVLHLVNEIPSPADAEGSLTLTGFALVERGRQHRGKRTASRIAVAPRVRNLSSEEETVSKSSVALFRRLERRIRKELRYATVQTFAKGRRHVDARSVLMTGDACALASTGIFDRDCGPVV